MWPDEDETRIPVEDARRLIAEVGVWRIVACELYDEVALNDGRVLIVWQPAAWPDGYCTLRDRGG